MIKQLRSLPLGLALALSAVMLFSRCGSFFGSSGSNGSNNGTGVAARFVYLAEATVSPISGAVMTYTIGSNNVTLSPANNPNGLYTYYPSSGQTTNWLAIDPSFNFLYVANSGSTGIGPGSVDLWQVDRSNGTLIGNSGSTGPAATYVSTNLQNPTAIAVSKNDYLYVTYANTISTSSLAAGAYVAFYSINSSTGVLTAPSQTPMPVGATPTSAVVDSSGSYLYVVSSNAIYVFDINSDGSLTASSQGTTPFSQITGVNQIAVTPNSTFAYVTAGTSGIYGLQISSTDGSLSTFSGNSNSSNGGTMVGVAVDPLGQWVYAITSDTNQIFGFTLNSTSGVLTALSTPTYTTGCSVSTGACTPSSIAIAPSDLVLYVANSADSTIGVYPIYGGGILSYAGYNTATASSSPKFVLVSQ
ncbi:MAG: beta-propeller fold lactonase family protein [Terriglobales bacterium]